MVVEVDESVAGGLDEGRVAGNVDERGHPLVVGEEFQVSCLVQGRLKIHTIFRNINIRDAGLFSLLCEVF